MSEVAIEKEDKVFFPASRMYFTDEKAQAMPAEFREFDREMIHEKYKKVITDFEDMNGEQEPASNK